MLTGFEVDLAGALTAKLGVGSAEEVADHVLFMDGGRIAESGPPERIFRDPSQERTREFLRKILPKA